MARGGPAALRAAAIAALGAGAIHATAAGAHGEHRAAVVAFVVTAIVQIGWGALGLVHRGRLVALAGVVVNGGALVGWALAKTSGIGFVDGLDVEEDPQLADTLAAGLAVVAVVGALAVAQRLSWAGRPRPGVVGAAALAAVALVAPAMISATSHTHPGGHDHAQAAWPATAVPYDARLPVDLGGVPGVSAEEQREAEDLVTVTLQRLPRFADPDHAYQLGYRSIRDGATGHEHYMKWELIDDGRILDPDHPESLVYEVDQVTGEKTLAAAMYMASRGDTLDSVPSVGGDLVQWHVHDDLCFTGDENAWVVADVAALPQACRPGTFRLRDLVPMVHVWIVPHECGPFAALEGIGAGQIAAGEERLCDHHHGAPA